MSDLFYLSDARNALAGRVTEPVESVLLVHPNPDRKKKWFGGKTLASKLHTNNYVAITATGVHLFALGGRDGMTVKDHLGSWPRDAVRLSVSEAERSSWMVSTGSSLDYRVHCLHLTGPELDVELDLRADPFLFTSDLDFLDQDDPDPDVQEAIDGLNEEREAVDAALERFVRSLAPA